MVLDPLQRANLTSKRQNRTETAKTKQLQSRSVPDLNRIIMKETLIIISLMMRAGSSPPKEQQGVFIQESRVRNLNRSAW